MGKTLLTQNATKYIVFITLLIFSCKSLKKNSFLGSKNTVFIFFDSKISKKNHIRTSDNKEEMIFYDILFEDLIDKPFSDKNIKFFYRKYPDFTSKRLENQTPNFELNSNFISDNKDIVINIDEIISLGFNEAINFFSECDNIYLIEKIDKSKKVLIKQVHLALIKDE